MKKLVSLVLALCLVLSMAAFTASAEGDIVKLTWAQGSGSTAPIDNAIVLEALNEISREKLGVECDIQYFTNDQIQLSMQAGEVFDMYFTCAWYNNFNTNVSNGMFANIEGKIQEWTPDLYALLTEDTWEIARSADGGLYAIPVPKDIAAMNFIVYDKSFADANGIVVPERIEKWDEMTDYLVALQGSMGEGEYAFEIAKTPAGWDTGFDFIDRTPLIGVIFGAEGEEATKVCVEFDDPLVMDRLRTIHKWYEMGLINPDAAVTDSVDDKHNHIFTAQAWTGYDYSPSRGYPCGMTCYNGPILNTDSVQGAMNAFSVTLEDDEARFKKALEYQQLVNTDWEYRNILARGIEGKHVNYYEFTLDNGYTAKAALQTELGSSNYSPWQFSQGSYPLTAVACTQAQVDGIDPAPAIDQWDRYYADIAAYAEVSNICGFSFNSEGFDNVYAEISAVKQEYMDSLTSGTVDPDVVVPEMLDKMYAAGLQDVIDACQAQLDAYMANK